MELRDYLKLKRRINPIAYRNAIYDCLKLEMSSELVFGGRFTLPEDRKELALKYNDKWNDIRREYIRVYEEDPVFMPEDWFLQRYESEMATEESLRNSDVYYLLDKALRKIGDDIYESE